MISRTFYDYNLAAWEKNLSNIFQKSLPEHYETTDTRQIIDILSTLGVEKPGLIFFPKQENLELFGCQAARNEKETIEILIGADDDSALICSPNKLIFDNIPNMRDGYYFWLELNKLPAATQTEAGCTWEVVSELSDGTYMHYVETNEELEMYKIRRTVSRQLKGPLLIVPKASYLNDQYEFVIHDHAKYTSPLFRTFVESISMGEGYVDFKKNLTD